MYHGAGSATLRGMSRTIMFLGDSLSVGYFATTAAEGYDQHVVAHLRESGELEAVGASRAGGKAKAGSILGMPTDVDYVIVELGTNDSLHTMPWVYAAQYDDLVKRVRESSPRAVVICVGLWRPTWRAWPYDVAVKRAAARYGATYVRMSDLYAQSDVRGPAGRKVEKGITDMLHPNDFGHAAIADRVIEAIKRAGVTVDA